MEYVRVSTTGGRVVEINFLNPKNQSFACWDAGFSQLGFARMSKMPTSHNVWLRWAPPGGSFGYDSHWRPLLDETGSCRWASRSRFFALGSRESVLVSSPASNYSTVNIRINIPTARIPTAPATASPRLTISCLIVRTRPVLGTLAAFLSCKFGPFMMVKLRSTTPFWASVCPGTEKDKRDSNSAPDSNRLTTTIPSILKWIIFFRP